MPARRCLLDTLVMIYPVPAYRNGVFCWVGNAGEGAVF